FYVSKFKSQYCFFIMSLFIFITILFIYMRPLPNLSIIKEDETTSVTKGNEANNKVSLTFDISWSNTKVYDILKTLKQHDIQATFFVSGEWAERHPHILEEIAEEKHEIGMLGYRYKSYVDQDIEEVKQDIQEAIQVFNKLDFDY